MELAVPASLRDEHGELHGELAAAMRASGAVGEAARTIATLLHPHFIDEETFALPLLGLLVPLARGDRVGESGPVLEMTERLKAALPRMLAEHRAITAAVRELQRVARDASDQPRLRLADKIIAHARAEEEIMYPAAILVGEYLKALR